MALDDMLLHINSYPDPTPPAAIDQAVGFAAAIGGTLSALTGEVTISLQSNAVANYLIHLSDLAQQQEAASAAACVAGLQHFKAQAEAAGVLGQALKQRVDLTRAAEAVARQARTRDLCMVPLAGPYDGQREVVEAVLFSSGRPVLVFRADEAPLPQQAPATVVLAWDGSRCAARAMADALPILKVAAQVRILTILGEKPEAAAGQGTGALRHLQAHGVAAEIDEVEADGRGIGAVLDACLSQHRADLLVMGGYGHSRLREVVLGGATEHVLAHPTIPVLLSH